MYFVVYRPDVFRHFPGGSQVGCAFQSDSERMEPGPPGFFPAVGFDSPGRVFLSDGRYNRGIQSAGEKHSIGDVRHELPFYGVFQGGTQGGDIGGIVFYGFVFRPIALIPAGHLPFAAIPIVSGQERFDAAANPFEGFQFGRRVKPPFVVPAYIERDDAYRVAGNQPAVVFRIVKGESENAVQVFEEIYAFFAV